MAEIMAIQDSFILPEKGIVVSGVNPLLDCKSSEHIKSLVGHRVRVAPAGKNGVLLNVKDVGVSESLVGKKNISILLDSAELESCARGHRILTAE